MGMWLDKEKGIILISMIRSDHECEYALND